MININKNKILSIIENWTEELNSITSSLMIIGDKSQTLEYNLMSCEALRLSRCITDLTTILVDL